MKASPPIFSLPVDALGVFQVKRMNPGLRIAVEVAAERMSFGPDGVKVQGKLLLRALHIVALAERVIVSAPEGFDLEVMDPADPEDFAKLVIWEDAYLAADARFRNRPWPPREALGPGAGADGGIPVSPQVQPGANGPAVAAGD